MKINTFSKNGRNSDFPDKTTLFLGLKNSVKLKKKWKIILKFQVQDKSVVEGVDCLMMHELVLGGERK